MAGKLKETMESPVSYTDRVMGSARQIYLAGLGAFMRSTEEGMKLFESLVAEGQKMERRTGDMAGGQVRGAVDRASEGWDRLEDMFEDRVAKAMSRLGVPSGEDIAKLEGRIDELRKRVDALAAERSAAKPAKPATRRTSSRTTKKAAGSSAGSDQGGAGKQ
ncbi:MAG: phasin family protein [Ectothiorhodospiraceae bacterium]|jgi:poly(hydroxyalkanoate) granule-associated protein